MMDSIRRQRMLAADSPEGLVTLRNIFGQSMELICTQSLDDAIGHFGDAIDLIVCGIHFDDSRMFDLLRMAKADPAVRKIPFVCYRDLSTELGQAVLEGLDIAAKALGAAAFVDVCSLKHQYGVASADDRFRQIVTGQMSAAR